MLVVSDTSPLNDLILIGHVDVLPTLFTRVLIWRDGAEPMPAHPRCPKCRRGPRAIKLIAL